MGHAFSKSLQFNGHEIKIDRNCNDEQMDAFHDQNLL